MSKAHSMPVNYLLKLALDTGIIDIYPKVRTATEMDRLSAPDLMELKWQLTVIKFKIALINNSKRYV